MFFIISSFHGNFLLLTYLDQANATLKPWNRIQQADEWAGLPSLRMPRESKAFNSV
jgi:hypothetical protein